MSFYDILGIKKTASDSEIKKAYRTKSFHYHPDRNNSQDANQKMRDINEAYETLQDKSKRRLYDMEQDMGNNPFGFFSNGLGMPFMRPNQNESPEDLNDVFASLFGNMLNPEMAQRGPNIRIFRGGMPPEHLFQGMGMPPEHLFQGMNSIHKMMKPESIMIDLEINLEQAYHGCSLPVNIKRWTMIGETKLNEEETLYVNIYEGIDNNEMILLGEKGNINSEQIKGDVKIIIKIMNDSIFQRKGLDLYYVKKLSLKDALCGFSFDIEHISQKKLSFNNKSNVTIVKPNYNKVIPNMGMKRDNKVGNLIVTFDIKFPDFLTEDQIDTLNTTL